MEIKIKGQKITKKRVWKYNEVKLLIPAGWEMSCRYGRAEAVPEANVMQVDGSAELTVVLKKKLKPSEPKEAGYTKLGEARQDD